MSDFYDFNFDELYLNKYQHIIDNYITDNVFIEKYYSKYKCAFNVETHKELIDKIRRLEESILRNSRILNKIPQFKIYEQIRNGNIKIFSDSFEKTNCLFTLKISGIWENEKFYGVTYKFIKINHI